MENTWAQQFKTLTDNGQYAEAKALLEQITTTGVAEERMRGHFQSQIHFYEGDYRKALEVAEQTEANFGANIRLTGDRVVYLYYLDAGPAYLQALQLFKNEFTLVSKKLSAESQFWSTLNLAKLLEEQGDFAVAIQLYSDLLTQDLDSERALRTQANLLRCYAILGRHEKIAKLYSEVFYSKVSAISRFARFEQEHALLLADLHILGHQGAVLRLQQILKNPEFDAQEKSLSYYDFLDVLMLTKPEICCEIHIDSDLIPAPQFFFEKEITTLFASLKEGRALALPDLYHLKASRSPVEVLRILSHCSRSRDGDVASFCRMQLSLLLESIPSASQKFWQHRLPQTSQDAFVLEIAEKKLLYNSRSLNLQRSAKQLQLLQLLAHQTHWTLSELGQELYGFWDDLSSFDRLRMLVRSLNENIRTLTGEPLMVMDEKTVSLRPQFSLRVKAEATAS